MNIALFTVRQGTVTFRFGRSQRAPGGDFPNSPRQKDENEN
jgi:hypothetical protein